MKMGYVGVLQDTSLGVRAGRKGLADTFAACTARDMLTVWKQDRLGRSLLDVLGLVEALKVRDICLKVLTGTGASIDATKAESRLFFSMFAAMAEFERELIRERTTAGMKAARCRRVRVGRPRKLGPDRLAVGAQLIAADKSQQQVANALGVAVSTPLAPLMRNAGAGPRNLG